MFYTQGGIVSCMRYDTMTTLNDEPDGTIMSKLLCFHVGVALPFPGRGATTHR